MWKHLETKLGNTESKWNEFRTELKKNNRKREQRSIDIKSQFHLNNNKNKSKIEQLERN